MIDDLGYPKIVDFGVADFEKDIVHGSHFGTLSYMAPEMVLNEQYSYSADYYSLGVLILLVLTGDIFAVGKTIEEAQKHVLKRRRTLTMKKLKKRYPFLSNEWIDFLYKLLQGYPNERLGSTNGIGEIKAHHWIKNIPWKQIENKSFESPLDKFVENYKNQKVKGEQHYIGLNKRDIALKEKEDKAKELCKNEIDVELCENFWEFKRMNVHLTEEEITYEEINDYQGSTHPDKNYFNKNMSTPSLGILSSNKGNEDKNSQQVNEYKTMKEYVNTNKIAGNCRNSHKSDNYDSIAIMNEIINNDDINICIQNDNKGNDYLGIIILRHKD